MKLQSDLYRYYYRRENFTRVFTDEGDPETFFRYLRLDRGVLGTRCEVLTVAVGMVLYLPRTVGSALKGKNYLPRPADSALHGANVLFPILIFKRGYSTKLLAKSI